jgi:hypothetical protein
LLKWGFSRNVYLVIKENNLANKLGKFSISIADVVVRFTSEDIDLVPGLHYKAFISDSLKADIKIKVYARDVPDISRQKKIFDSAGPWSLYDWQGKYLFAFRSPAVTPNLYEVAIFDPDFTTGEVYLPDYYLKGRTSYDPLTYPLDELLMVNYLAHGRGIDIHALGIIAADSFGMAFTGVSGAGKSTTAGLWKGRKEAKILCDDRIILRREEGVYWMHSTPWHGTAGIAVPGKAPLRSLFFLKQAKENRIVPLKPTDAATRLVVRCFPTFYRQAGMEYALDMITDLVQKVPCYELQFTPDQRAVDEVLNNVKRLSS